jgi:hypothetical protein
MELPPPYAVYCVAHPNKRNGLTKPYPHRVGPAKDVEHAKRLIAEDRAEMRKTFGGLIDAPGDAGREYFIFKAKWERIECQ